MQKQLVYTLLLSCLNWLGFQTEQFTFSSELDFEILQVGPDSDLGRWYSGQVNIDGQWRRIEQVQQLLATDSRWQAYQRVPTPPMIHKESNDGFKWNRTF